MTPSGTLVRYNGIGMSLIQKILIVLPALFIASPTLAVSGENHSRSVSEVVSAITASQNVSGQSDISCDAVTDNQFDELGDAVMQAKIGDDEAHEVMDNMMGGEGSESLRSMHIAMGQRYLGCAQSQSDSMGMIPLRQGFAGHGGTDRRGGDGFMMSNFYGPWGMAGMGGIGMLLFWVIVIVGIVLLVKWLTGQQHMQSKGKSALDILAERYAKGEIDKQEFEDKKKDLT